MGGSIRGRLGYAADSRPAHVTGGAAVASIETSISPLPAFQLAADALCVGWTVGTGLDYAITNNWFMGLVVSLLAVSIQILGVSDSGSQSWNHQEELSNNPTHPARLAYKF